jgi:hypothetical protein
MKAIIAEAMDAKGPMIALASRTCGHDRGFLETALECEPIDPGSVALSSLILDDTA